MIENEEISRDMVIMACVKYMSEDDVADMMEANEIIEPEDVSDEFDAIDAAEAKADLAEYQRQGALDRDGKPIHL